MPFDDLYEKHGRRTGLDPALLKRFAQIENSERAGGCTGSYCGLFQLSQSEFRRHGGSGSIFDPEQNTMAAANKLSQESRNFEAKYGRKPDAVDLYLIHNQGEAGYAAHVEDPDRPAWQSMYTTGEGQSKGAGWSKLAVRLNTPGGVGQYGGIGEMTSGQFYDAWKAKFNIDEGHEPTGLPHQGRDEEEHEYAGIITSDDDSTETAYGKGRPSTRAGRGAADANKMSLLSDVDFSEPAATKPKVPSFQTPDLVPKFV